MCTVAYIHKPISIKYWKILLHTALGIRLSWNPQLIQTYGNLTLIIRATFRLRRVVFDYIEER